MVIDDEARRKADEARRDRREKNVARTFVFALGVGVLGLLIFAASVSEAPLPPAATKVGAGPTSTTGKMTSTTSTTGPADTTATTAATEEGAPSTTTLAAATEEKPATDRCPVPCPLAAADTAQPTRWRIFGLGLLAAGASGLLGALLGFLFGLPRMPSVTRPSGRSGDGNQGGKDTKVAAGQPDTQSALVDHDAFRNNNLIEISDWLAKIIVGAGLVGIKDLTPWLGTVGTALGTGAGLGYGYLAAAFGVTVIMYFLTLGFLFAYINTRTVVTLMLATTDRSIIDELLAQGLSVVKQQVEDSVSSSVQQQVVASVSSVQQQFDNRAEEAKIFGLLYSGDPGAPAQAVKVASEFLAKPGNESNPRVWLYLACAFGQLHAAETDPARKSDHANNALGALKKALEYEPGVLPTVRGLLYPNDPNHFEGDDDLISLGSDERFKQLAGPPPAPTTEPPGGEAPPAPPAGGGTGQ